MTDAAERKPLQDGTCPICGDPGKVRQSHQPWEIRHCRWCDFAWVWPPMAPEEHQRFHGPEFFERYYAQPIADFYAEKGALYHRERTKKQWFLDFFSRHVRPGRILDIGAGQAMFDYLAREKGYEPSLVELCPPVVEYHRSQGLEVFAGYPEHLDFADESFEGVAMWHSLEHVFEPLQTLREVARVLKPGGCLVGALPNWRGLGTWLRLKLGKPLFNPETNHELHFSHFSPRAMRRALLRAGLEPLEIGVEWHRPRCLRDRVLHHAGQMASFFPGLNVRETMTFVARKPAGERSLSPRPWVRHRNDAGIPANVHVERPIEHPDPEVSVLIPTSDGAREGYLPGLLEQLREQDLPRMEVLLVVGDNRQGRALNTAADLARGEVLVTLDDDSRLADPTTLSRLVAALRSDPSIGMAGGSNQPPPDARGLVRRVMEELPRRSSPAVGQITDSDMAEHPCLAMPRAAFMAVGGENELIPRGLDPYLRTAFREAGYRVVVVPGVVYHHLPPTTLIRLLRQFFRNGAQSRYCSQLYPEWVYDTVEEHQAGPAPRVPVGGRALRLARGVAQAAMKGHWVHVACRLSYAAGWLWQSLGRSKTC